MFKVLDKSYLNVSGNIYDADFISLAQVANDKLSFDERTLFLDQSVKDTLNKETIMPFESVIYIGNYKGKYRQRFIKKAFKNSQKDCSK